MTGDGSHGTVREADPSSSVASRFARGASWSLLGTGAAQGLTVIASIICARLLGKVTFGEFGMVISTVAAFGILAGLGLGLTATKYVAQYRLKDPQRAGRILGLSGQVAAVSGGGIWLALFAIAPWLAASTLSAPHMADELRIGSILLLLGALDGMQVGALAGLEAFKTIARINLVRGLLSFPLLIVGVRFFGLTGAVAATVLVGAAGWLLSLMALRTEATRAGVPITYGWAREDLPIVWNFALPALLSTMMVAPIMWLANAIVANNPGGYGEIGLFSAANQWRAVLMFLPSVLLRVALPLMASSLEPADSADFGKTLLLTQGLTVSIALPAGALLMFLSDPIMALYGEEFARGGTVLIGVASSLMISSIGSGTGTVIEARGKMWRGVLLNLSWGVVVTIAVWSLAGAWGAKALAFGYALAYLVLSLWGFWYVASDLPPQMLPRLFWALGYTACLTLICLLLPPGARILLAVPAALLTACATLLAFVDKGVSRSIRARLLTPLRRGVA